MILLTVDLSYVKFHRSVELTVESQHCKIRPLVNLTHW